MLHRLEPNTASTEGTQQGCCYAGNEGFLRRIRLEGDDRGRLTARQIEAARRAMTRHIKRGGRIFIRIFPDKPVSQKPAEVRMGTAREPGVFVAESGRARCSTKWTGWMSRRRGGVCARLTKLPLRTMFVFRQMG